MCINKINLTKVKEAYRYYKRQIYLQTREWWCCFKYGRKRKQSDPITAFYNPYYDPYFVELREVVVVTNDSVPIVTEQPKLNPLYFDSSDDEIIFSKDEGIKNGDIKNEEIKHKHIVEINEDNKFNEIFNPSKRRLSYDLNLSAIPEDIDSSMERITPNSPPQSPPTQVSSPDEENMGFDNLEEEYTTSLSKSNISIKSINVGDEDEDNWDLLEN
jgi:hypothetical protein